MTRFWWRYIHQNGLPLPLPRKKNVSIALVELTHCSKIAREDEERDKGLEIVLRALRKCSLKTTSSEQKLPCYWEKRENNGGRSANNMNAITSKHGRFVEWIFGIVFHSFSPARWKNVVLLYVYIKIALWKCPLAWTANSKRVFASRTILSIIFREINIARFLLPFKIVSQLKNPNLKRNF